MTRLFGYLGVFILATGSLYISRFWLWPLPWSNKGLWGIKALSPNGDVLRRVLRGTPFEVFDLVIWLGVVVLVLTLMQWLSERLIK